MLTHHRRSPRRRIELVIAVVAALTLASASSLTGRAAPGVPAQSGASLASTIFTFDGKDFIRSRTTLVTEAGTSAANTKLDHATDVYKALMQKRSYAGVVTVFGKKYDGSYAPIIGSDGKMTGALFVGVPK